MMKVKALISPHSPGLESREVVFQPHEKSEYKQKISNYVREIQFQSQADLKTFACALPIFADHLARSGTADTAMEYWKDLIGISHRSKHSILSHMQALCGMFFEPDLWAEQSKFPALRSLICRQITKDAERMLQLPSPEQCRYVKDQALGKRMAQQQNDELHKIRCSSKRQRISILSEKQFDEELTIVGWLEDLYLGSARNLAVPLIEDHPLLLAMMEKIPNFYCDLPHYIGGNLRHTLKAIEFGQCNVEHLAVEFQQLSEVQRAKCKWEARILDLVQRYFGKSGCESAKIGDIQRVLSYQELTNDLYWCEKIATLVARPYEIEGVLPATQYYLTHSRGVSNAIPDLYESALHMRALFSRIFRGKEAQNKLFEMVGDLDEQSPVSLEVTLGILDTLRDFDVEEIGEISLRALSLYQFAVKEGEAH